MDISKLHPVKLIGVLLTIFGAVQLMQPQFQAVLSPGSYFWFTLVLGILVTVLGRMKMAGDGLFARNKTWVTGVLLIIFSVLQGVSDQLKDKLTPHTFALFTLIVGLVIAILGVLNTLGDDTAPAPPTI